ncbi:hypothetical protein MGYG_08127 [Nannizzia gypsea CBS 118893]|uniref:Uncharacterized protein n=1 Tax=Arthroderma gypseum (strain ATCC MYA-4604 / CBS 118893) TaxID=535722 RepID=E4V544_ARTGP|nr:hypothetical protein MGYG_08127 [Nannizzia gypsea CBS 118893]EFR05118.1 hypothetical protein MGYG_08127 [Nannizzia gypsea CBS 118893]
MKLTTITAVLVGMLSVSVTEATVLQMCKKTGKRDCLPVDATWSICTNLVSKDGRPYVSGWSTGGDCDIYEGRDCKGTANSIDKDGWSRFPFNVWSVLC